MVVAAWANALVLREFDLMDNLIATRAFLPETLRHLAFFPALRFERWSFENGHVLCPRRGRRVNGKRAGLFQDTRAFAQGRARR